MTLAELIKRLLACDQNKVVQHGFGEGHSDRGDYANAAFAPVRETTFGEMLRHARSILDTEQSGWKGGRYVMYGHVKVHIGEWGECGEPITPHHFLYWEETSPSNQADETKDKP